MKLPQFDYVRPASLHEAVDLLAKSDGEGTLIAGGQSLIPMLAFRMAAPEVLVDISQLEDTRRISVTRKGVEIGATARWCEIEESEKLEIHHPLLLEAIKHVAHYQIRSSGTPGGSIVHADPSAEFPAIAMACNAEVVIQGPGSIRTVSAAEFIEGALTTNIETDEIVTSIRFPRWNRSNCWAFEEYSRRRGDFAMAGIALFFEMNRKGRIKNPHVCAFGVGDRADRISVVETYLENNEPNMQLIEGATELLTVSIDPLDDIHGSGEYRAALAGTLFARAMMRASGIERDQAD